jgi:PQQ-like domain
MGRKYIIGLAVVVATLMLISVVGAASTHPDRFNANGNVLISDQFNNRIIEVNPATGHIVWSFGANNSSDGTVNNTTVVGPNWAERLSGGRTLIAGTGIGAGASPDLPNGAADDRVFVVNKAGKIVWQYGQAGVAGNGTNQLDTPVAAIQLPNGNYLITDQANNRIIEVNKAKKIVWSYGNNKLLNDPNSAELLKNGHILIADENNNRVIEITRGGKIVWKYSGSIQAAAFASRLPNGDTLITDSGNSRIIEVNPSGHITFKYATNTTVGSNTAPLPSNAVMLKDGNIMIADQFNHRVFEINHAKRNIWQYGKINKAGNGKNMLNAPYTVFVIGDYTGQTMPQI